MKRKRAISPGTTSPPIIAEWLGIYCHVQGTADVLTSSACYREPSCLVLASRFFAGIVAANDGEGWYPLYPYKPDYPVGCTLFRPSAIYTTWLHAILASLQPDPYLEGTTHQDKKRATDVAQGLEKHRSRDAEHLLADFADLYPDLYMDIWVDYSIAFFGT